MYACPICNGLSSLSIFCPICHHIVEDHGRVSDLFGDYSPYQSIDLCKRSDGWIDLRNHICVHQIYCSSCGYTNVEMILENFQ